MHYDVGVVGLGYVGLTLATAMAEVGLKVLGVEKRPEVVDMTNRGEPHFAERGLADILSRVTRAGALRAACDFPEDATCDAYIITVGTPLAPDGAARLDMIRDATAQVAGNMSDGALIILRSTVKIGTAREVVAPVLQASGKSFAIAMCPERTLEGKAMQELRELPQIIGADDPDTAERCARLFGRLTKTVVKVGGLEAAEIVKLVDNTFRDVQFAFANEVARLCEGFGVNANEVIKAGKLGYPRTNVALPGLVGGPCLEKDPHILHQSASARGLDLEITRTARFVNERQPAETADLIVAELKRRGAPDAPIVALMGLAFKGVPETDDLRGSMSIKVLRELRARLPQARIRLFDPVVHADALRGIDSDAEIAADMTAALAGAHVGVIANNHPALGASSPARLAEGMADSGFIYDYWNHFSDLSPAELGDAYFAVGNIGRVA
jgi:UDP-N-acetyl-D-mannosaminuronic acid dehydrogenase